MIGEIAAVLGALKALNDGISTLKQAKDNAGGFSALLSKWADVDEKIRDVEQKKTGRMSYKEALDLEAAKRQIKNFDQQLKDICILQQQGDLYFDIKNRMDEARVAHEKEVAKLRIKRKEMKKFYKQIGIAFGSSILFMGVCFLILWLVLEFL
jgi:DNA repair exonuclease SbcCD ATPase subunit